MTREKSNPLLSPGTAVRVRAGVAAPEFPDVDCTGWTGRVTEVLNKKTNPKYVVAWDDATLSGLPDDYHQRCEQAGLLFELSCFPGDDLEPLE